MVRINGLSQLFQELLDSEVVVNVNVTQKNGTIEKHKFLVFPIRSSNSETLRINTKQNLTVFDSLGDNRFLYEVGHFFSGPQI